MATAFFLFCFVLVAAVPGDEEEEEEERKRSIILCVVDYKHAQQQQAVLVSSEAPLTSSVCVLHARACYRPQLFGFLLAALAGVLGPVPPPFAPRGDAARARFFRFFLSRRDLMRMFWGSVPMVWSRGGAVGWSQT